jgi:hypothetical protein
MELNLSAFWGCSLESHLVYLISLIASNLIPKFTEISICICVYILDTITTYLGITTLILNFHFVPIKDKWNAFASKNLLCGKSYPIFLLICPFLPGTCSALYAIYWY